MSNPDTCPKCKSASMSPWNRGQNARCCDTCGHMEEKPKEVKTK